MSSSHSAIDQSATAPEVFRSALAELAQIGLSVARLVGLVAEAEMAAVKEALRPAISQDDLPTPTSLVEAIEADRAFADAAAARQTAMTRVETIARVFAGASRSMRMTVLLAERLDRGWARRGRVDEGSADDRAAMARRQVARGVAQAIALEAGPDAERAERLTEAYSERLEQAEIAEETHDRPTDEIITEICRGLGFDPVRRVVTPPLPDGAGLETAVAAAAGEMPDGVRVETQPWWLTTGMTRDGPVRAAPDD